MCDVIKIRLTRRDGTRSKIKYKPHLKFGNPTFKIGRSTVILIFSGWFPFPLLVAILLFLHIFMTSHMTLSSVSVITSPPTLPLFILFSKLRGGGEGFSFLSYF